MGIRRSLHHPLLFASPRSKSSLFRIRTVVSIWVSHNNKRMILHSHWRGRLEKREYVSKRTSSSCAVRPCALDHRSGNAGCAYQLFSGENEIRSRMAYLFLRTSTSPMALKGRIQILRISPVIPRSNWPTDARSGRALLVRPYALGRARSSSELISVSTTCFCSTSSLVGFCSRLSHTMPTTGSHSLSSLSVAKHHSAEGRHAFVRLG